jgi:hypothetical protein
MKGALHDAAAAPLFVDTMAAMAELRRIELEAERRFGELLDRLVGMPADTGIALAEELLAAYNAHRVATAMQAKAFLGVEH